MPAQPGQPTTYIFDFGGVLLDWNVHHLFDKLLGDPTESQRVLTEIGFSEWNLALDRGRSFAESVRELSGQFPQYAHLIRAFDERWEESLNGPIQATVDLLHTLKEGGSKLYGLTNWSTEKYELTRPKYAFFDLFDEIIVSGQVKLVKPDPRIFALTLEKIGRPARDCLFIDDSAPNIAAARQLGFQTVHFKSAEQLKFEISQFSLLEGNPQGETRTAS